MPSIHLLIKGKVQGVFYRATAKKIADKLRITGWIKNTKEGNVEVMATGYEVPLQEFLQWCKNGPEKAHVEDVIVTREAEMIFNNFEIVR